MKQSNSLPFVRCNSSIALCRGIRMGYVDGPAWQEVRIPRPRGKSMLLRFDPNLTLIPFMSTAPMLALTAVKVSAKSSLNHA